MLGHSLALALATTTLPGLVSAAPSGTDAPVVTLRNGSYYGIHNSAYNQDYFLGMPYAQPPLKDLRFRHPHSLNTTWDGLRNATEYQSKCYQYGYPTGPLTGGSDDCLHLNVIRPSGVADEKLPVLVWIHGGGLVGGFSGDPGNNLTYLVDESVKMGSPIVAVSINYRLAAWGYLWSKAIKEAGEGNNGFRDQRFALQWIQENIAAFGGDPDKVTIWGQSGGARGVASQLTAYGGRDDGLFRAAILESATGFHTAFREETVKDALDWDKGYAQLLKLTGCESAKDSLQCLREVPSLELAEKIGNITFPVYLDIVDGDFIQDDRSGLVRQGKFAHVPVINGAATDDGDFFAQKGINTTTEWEAYLRKEGASNSTIEAISALYPDIPRVGLPATFEGRPTGELASYGAQWKRALAFGGDRAMHAPRRAWVKTWAAANLSAYSYRFDVVSGDRNPVQGAGHSVDLPFVFRNTDRLAQLNATEPIPGSFNALAVSISRKWISFAANLDPNFEGMQGEKWPAYEEEGGKNLVFHINDTSLVHVEDDTYRTEQLEYLNKKLWKTGLEEGK
ncbi:Carboxylic ester hydrolase [Fusarium keratoplasticum]|uniref:Carboxylic ester hydrolase n=1 Tax=Fusarium keratoplasticum TaxID=1328300 RepID=A0ACC0R7G2_9HYPO|nr:Carboxylic ester hydrolase [Fusarium keratoplasticum]KAI8679341.1 Carboxylic ester hydrolase [Fusarium keratoplasticum]